MKLQQLISTGFAVTAFAAATIPAVGWTLLGSVEAPPPAPMMQASWDATPLAEAEQAMLRPVRYEPRTQGMNSISW